MDFKQIVKTILVKQNELNSATSGAAWTESKNNYFRAAWIEAGELAQHYGYKWWKKEESDIQQCQLEVIDISHFMFSEYIRIFTIDLEDFDLQELKESYEYSVSLEKNRKNTRTEEEIHEDTLSSIEELISSILDYDSYILETFECFFYIMSRFDITIENLLVMYMGKNALNTLRQNFGYRDGSYVKIWDGSEDNVHLYEIIEEVQETPELDLEKAYDLIYSKLKERYSKIMEWEDGQCHEDHLVLPNIPSEYMTTT